MTAIAAHRGGADLWPENSFSAFRRAAALPVEFVEFDVHVSADGRLVVHHDATLDRMTDRSGAIMDLTWAEIADASVRGAGGERPPSLDEVVDIFRPTDVDLRVEIKLNALQAPYPDIEARVAAALVSAGMLERTVVTAFQLDALARFRAAAEPGRGVIWLIAPPTLRHIGGIETAAALARGQGVEEIAPRAPDVDAAMLARAEGVRLGAYAVNDRHAIRRMLDLGVVAFTTDRPDIALEERDGRQPTQAPRDV